MTLFKGLPCETQEGRKEGGQEGTREQHRPIYSINTLVSSSRPNTPASSTTPLCYGDVCMRARAHTHTNTNTKVNMCALYQCLYQLNQKKNRIL